MLVINITRNLLCERKNLGLINRNRMCEVSEFTGTYFPDITEKQIRRHITQSDTMEKKGISEASQPYLKEAEGRHLEGEKAVNSRVNH